MRDARTQRMDARRKRARADGGARMGGGRCERTILEVFNGGESESARGARVHSTLLQSDDSLVGGSEETVTRAAAERRAPEPRRCAQRVARVLAHTLI